IGVVAVPALAHPRKRYGTDACLITIQVIKRPIKPLGSARQRAHQYRFEISQSTADWTIKGNRESHLASVLTAEESSGLNIQQSQRIDQANWISTNIGISIGSRSQA